MELSLHLARGRNVHVEAVTREVVWGEAVQMVTCIFDISMRKNMEEHLRQSQRLGAIGQLAGGVAHDFNNLLGAILGFTDISLNVLDEEHEVSAYLHKIKGAGKRAKELVAQILAFSRHEGSNRRVVNMTTVLEETVSFLRGSVPSSVRIVVQEPATNCAIRANPTEILQVLMNIATNAVQAMNDVGQLTIRGSEYEVKEATQGVLGELMEGRYGVFTIKDTGVGMDATILPNIFEPYFTTKPMGRGTGLGLSMVYGIIRSHKGNIKVTSIKGVGTTFNLFFPLVPTAEYERVTEEAGQKIARGKGRVMLVDDEAALVEMGETILRLLGYSVTSTTSSREALSILLEDPSLYDLLITDQTMPTMTGTELIESIRMVRPDMPVLLITGYNSRIDKGNAAAFGIEHFYMKPLEMHEFAQAVRAAMGSTAVRES